MAELVQEGVGDYSMPISNRIVMDMAANANNYLKYCCNFKLSSEMFIPTLKSVLGSTAENVILQTPIYFIPHSHGAIDWTINQRHMSGDGQLTWRLYAFAGLYGGPTAFDRRDLVGEAAMCSAWGSMETYWQMIKMQIELPPYLAGKNSRLRFLITAQAPDETSQDELCTSDIQLACVLS